jgi:chorismate-pyruvate lyase
MRLERRDDIHELTQSPLWPLNLFCAHYGREVPEITPLFGQHIPEPYKELLVHDRNMTPTLEAYHHGTIYIEPVNVFSDDEETTREVILRRGGDGKPLEYGAARVFRGTLTPEALFLIDDGRLPLGTILRVCDCEHTVRPSGFFKIRSTAFFADAFDAREIPYFYGRRNTLVAPNGSPIAEVCEILPPEKKRQRKRGRQ